ncbi:MAG TPA: TIGR00730 family Rossman fold protein [Rhizomicrobium sp.]|jgi:hypothetical protein|nr:TIGR00730 family Rossman fold protein [Rhizomicrobium sp.]
MLNPERPKCNPALCVFCGSSPGKNPKFAQEARALGRLLAGHGYALVFGGGGLGLMGEVARAARDGGANIHGILPDFLRHLEPPLAHGERVTIAPDLFARKAQMMNEADAFVILPGGMGTLDEFGDVVTGAQLDVHKKPIVLVNVDGFFDPLLALIDHLVQQQFAQPAIKELFSVVANAEEAITLLDNRLNRAHAR